MLKNNLEFSVVIPSYNEGEDVRLSIESALNQDYPALEILVLDDSNDDTPQIVLEYRKRGVRLVDGPSKGCCEAKNEGMRLAKGDVVLIVNADVVLPPDFLTKIKAHYEVGADYVLVESRVFNTENFWARFIEMQHRYEIKKLREKAEWTEGFSARKNVLTAVGLIPGDFTQRFCRDWLLGQKLSEFGYKKVVDFSIVVVHKAPDNFKDYLRVRKARGRFGALTQYFLYKKTLSFLFFKFLAKDIIFIFKFIMIIPAVVRVFNIDRYSSEPFADFFLFFYAYFIQETARVVGEWEGLFLVSRG